MSLYKKRTKTVEAFQWTGGPNQTEDPEWLIEAIKAGNVWVDNGGLIHKAHYITVSIEPGGWVSKDENGNIELWTNAMFNAQYELVGESK